MGVHVGDGLPTRDPVRSVDLVPSPVNATFVCRIILSRGDVAGMRPRERPTDLGNQVPNEALGYLSVCMYVLVCQIPECSAVVVLVKERDIGVSLLRVPEIPFYPLP